MRGRRLKVQKREMSPRLFTAVVLFVFSPSDPGNSQSSPANPDVPSDDPTPCAFCGNPINVATGSKFQIETDFTADPLDFARTIQRRVRCTAAEILRGGHDAATRPTPAANRLIETDVGSFEVEVYAGDGEVCTGRENRSLCLCGVRFLRTFGSIAFIQR